MDSLRKLFITIWHFAVAAWGRFWPWYRAQTRRMQIIVGSVALVGACGCCGWFSVATESSTIPHITSSTLGKAPPPITFDPVLAAAQATKTAIAAATETAQPTAISTSTATTTAATATPKPGSPPQATPPPPRPTTPPPPRYPAINGNPYDLTLTNTGHLVYNPPSDICNWLNCIAAFWTNTAGYVDLCGDGTYSHSGGRTGACSKHGNEKQPVYQP